MPISSGVINEKQNKHRLLHRIANTWTTLIYNIITIRYKMLPDQVQSLEEKLHLQNLQKFQKLRYQAKGIFSCGRVLALGSWHRDFCNPQSAPPYTPGSQCLYICWRWRVGNQSSVWPGIKDVVNIVYISESHPGYRKLVPGEPPTVLIPRFFYLLQ